MFVGVQVDIEGEGWMVIIIIIIIVIVSSSFFKTIIL